MKARIAYWLFKIKESFWFLPTVMVLTSIVVSRVALSVDQLGHMTVVIQLFWFGAPDIESSRLILSTITGAMITTASLVFSLTLVSLTLASQQLGPRLLSMFLRDRMTQAVLGLFLATFIYALIVLMALGGVELRASVPIFSMTIAIFATFSSFVALIVFIHHLATSLQADEVVARVSSELLTQIEAHFCVQDGDAHRSMPTEVKAPSVGATLTAYESGYVQALDHDALLELACANGARVRVLRRPGHFLSRGEPLALIHPEPEDLKVCEATLRRAVVFGTKRTAAQDPEFSLMSIVEIALRALSPGINDPHTANTCVDRLSDALRTVFERDVSDEVRCDDNGEPRLFLNSITVNGMLDAAFNEIRQFGASNVAVSVRLAEALARLAAAARTQEHIDAVRRHCELLNGACARCTEEQADMQAIERVIKRALRSLDGRVDDTSTDNATQSLPNGESTTRD